MKPITNTQDVIDSRDIVERIAELEAEQEALKGEWDGLSELDAPKEFLEWEKEHGKELDALRALAVECEGVADWEYGETLIRYSYFKDYAQELAEDCGMIPEGLSWPCNCIDWDQAARELQYDYMLVSFDGVDYWIRNC